MNWVLFSGLVILIGIATGLWWIAVIGGVILILDLAKPKSKQTQGSKNAVRHRLIQAPINAWDTDQDDMLTFLAAEHGMPNQLGVDILEPITGKIGDSLGTLETGMLRQVLPFKSYGESSALQRTLAGLVIPIDNWLYPKTFEAKMKGKLKGSTGKTFVVGQEEEAKKSLENEKK